MTGEMPSAIRQDEYDRLMGIINEIRAENAAFREELKRNSAATAQTHEMVGEMVELFSAAKGFFKMLGWIGGGLKWVTALMVAIAALWALVTHSGLPPTK